MKPLLGAVLLAACASVRPASLSAQSIEVRATLDSVFIALGSAKASPDVAVAHSRCEHLAGRARALCDAFIKLRLAELDPTTENAVRADQAFRAVHFHEEKWPYMWYGLGLTRMVMARTMAIAREGPLQPPGVTNEAAASHALVRALELDPRFVLAAEALALAPIPREGASQMEKRVAMLRTVRASSLALSPTAWAMMGVVERTAGSPDSAAAVLARALEVGSDSGFSGYELARALYLARRPDEGRLAILAGAVHGRSPLGQARFDRTVRLVGNPAEIVAWDSLAPGARGGWFASFWDRRDVRDGRASGESLTEHFRRVEDAWRRFRIDLPRTGRHKDAGMSDGRGGGVGGAMGGLDANESVDIYVGGYAINSPFRTFTLPDDQLDDRGMITIRHGDPARQAITVGQSGPDVELWRYDLPDGPRFFAFREVKFDGTTGAGVLTPQVAGASNRQQLCAVDERLCYVVQGRESIQAANMQAEGLEAIRIGTTTDAHRREFTGRIEPIVQIYGLDRDGGGAPRLVSAFAVPAAKLQHGAPPEAGGRTVYTLRLQLMALSATGVRHELDTTRHFATARPLGAGEFITGILELPVSAGQYTASLVITQLDGRGAVASLGTAVAPGRSGLTLSDVVLGREGSGVRWNSGATVVPLNPLNAYAVGGSAELYYQLGGLKVGTTYETKLEFLRAGEEEKAPKLALSFRDEAREEWRDVLRTVSLGELAPGRYRLVVRVTGAGSTVTSSAWLTVAKK